MNPRLASLLPLQAACHLHPRLPRPSNRRLPRPFIDRYPPTIATVVPPVK